MGPAASSRLPPETALARFGVRFLVCARCAPCVRRYKAFVCVCSDDCVSVMSVFVSQCVPLFVSAYKSGLRAGPLSFWGISSTSAYVGAEAFQERTLDGGANRPLGIKVSWNSSSEEGGAAHGPLHPALSTSKFFESCFSVLLLGKQVSVLASCFGVLL